MNRLQTPEYRFELLPEYPFKPHFCEVGGLRMHYVDEGDSAALPVVMLHGEPTWSYLYRKMIPPITSAGFRALVPDFIGFGKSDKPVDQYEYTYQRIVNWTQNWLEQLNLHRIALVCQDWGSFIGLRLVAQNPEIFSGVVIANGFLPDGITSFPPAFYLWRMLAKFSPVLKASWIVQMGTTSWIPIDVRAGYDAPFPNPKYQAGLRALPFLVPTTEDNPGSILNRELWRVLASLKVPILTVFGDHDPIFRGMDSTILKRMSGAKIQQHLVLAGAGHFIQEDRGNELAEIIINFVHESIS